MIAITSDGKKYLQSCVDMGVENIKQCLEKIPIVRESELLYTTEQVAKEIGRTTMAVKTYPAKFDVGTKIGRDWFFTADDLEVIRNRDDNRLKK